LGLGADFVDRKILCFIVDLLTVYIGSNPEFLVIALNPKKLAAQESVT
jgi:hypothetical protein